MTCLPRKSVFGSRQLRGGFSLLELVITLLVVAVLLTAVTTIIIATVDAKVMVESESRARKLGPAIVEIIARDLRNAWATGPDREIGVTGSYFYGKTNGDGDASADELYFVTTVDSYMLYQGLHSEITEVGYYLKDNPSGDGLKSLYRREDFSVDKEPSDGGVGVKMSDRVISFRVRYYERPRDETDPSLYAEVLKPGGFLENNDWDAKDKNRLPYAVRIELILDTTSTDSHTRFDERRIGVFTAVVRLPDYPELRDNFKIYEMQPIAIPKPADPNAPPADPNPNPNPPTPG